MATNYDQRSTTAGNRKASGKTAKAKKNKMTKIVIFTVELLVIAVMLGVLYMVTRVTKTDEGGMKIEVIDKGNLAIPQEIVDNEVMKGYTNIALFGVDISKEKTDAEGNVIGLLPAGTLRDSGLLKGFRSDTIMIASVNQDTGDIKLVSVYRDTFLNIGDSYSKCNGAYAKGGAEQAVKMLNTNLDMDIEDFVTVSYWALIEVIDALGGVYIDIDKNELPHLNNYGLSISWTMDVPYEPVAAPGYQLVSGIQAAGYCRIRAIGNDFARTERQREVLKSIESQAKGTDLNKLLTAFENAQRDIYTSLQPDEIVGLISKIGSYRIAEEGGFPLMENLSTRNMGAKGSCVVPEDLESNVKWLHEFLFNDSDYTVTGNVKEYSEYIKSFAAKYPIQ